MTTLHDKLKRRWMGEYMTGVEAESLMAGHYHQIARGVAWRNRHINALIKAVAAGMHSQDDLRLACDSFVVCRQIEDDLTDYQDRLTELTEQAANGEITPEEYESQVEELALVVLLLALLLGRNPDPDDAPEDERVLIAQLQAYLTLGGSPADISGIMAGLEAIDLPDDIRDQFDDMVVISNESVPGLTEAAITKGADEGAASLASRLGLWIFTAFGMYNLGKMARRDDPRLRWDLGATERHCGDCSRLAGQVHTASEWASSGWRPQGSNLGCRGFRCDCRLVETSSAVSGSF